MSHVFYLRSIHPPIGPEDVTLTEDVGGCFGLHRVNWKESFLAANGGRMLCWYEAPDAESARIALRQLKASMEGVWPGTVIGEDGTDSPALSDVNFLAELRLPEPRGQCLAAVAAALRQEDAALVRGFVSTTEPKAVCVVHAPSDRAVRTALESTDVLPEAVWACTPITPAAR